MSKSNKFLCIDDVIPYRISFMLSNKVWNIVVKWNYFAKTTLGNQYVRAIDSISANISEGWGRYNRKDKVKFYYYARGSVEESKDWTRKAYLRKLIKKEEYKEIVTQLKSLPKEINQLILITNRKLNR